MIQGNNKISPNHLKRKAVVYIRQSTIKQVQEHTESTKQQYGLTKRAERLGWPKEDIIVIDDDLGLSGASSEKRMGFKKLIAEVALGNVGAVFGLEVSRLARSCADWYRLLELCSITDTLIIDSDGVYNPNMHNDRLLLGLKGTVSEAELHIIKARLYGGKINRAKRGELRLQLPTGLTYNSKNEIILEPDKQVRDTLKLVFDKFRELKSARAVVRYFKDAHLRIPCREGEKSPLRWVKLSRTRVVDILKNPLYAGAYAYGRTKVNRSKGSSKIKTLSMDQWIVLIKDHHQGYITWNEYLENIKQLEENSFRFTERGIIREGGALLQGIAICGICGHRMRVRYSKTIYGEQVCLLLYL
jgi:DNA invertase Pin-like site-specific DNA recombinase